MPTSICTIRFQIRTILFAFRRVRVCVCFLVSHPCETMGTHAKASLPCLPLPLHQSLLFSLIFVKEHLSLALLAPPVAPTHSIPTTIAKEQHTLASHHHTCLPCQREVDWRQGTNLNIIAFTCDMSTLFILQTFLPSRRRDCNTYCALSISLTPPLTIPQSQ